MKNSHRAIGGFGITRYHTPIVGVHEEFNKMLPQKSTVPIHQVFVFRPEAGVPKRARTGAANPPRMLTPLATSFFALGDTLRGGRAERNNFVNG